MESCDIINHLKALFTLQGLTVYKNLFEFKFKQI